VSVFQRKKKERKKKKRKKRALKKETDRVSFLGNPQVFLLVFETGRY